jgi:hypothetical protein
MNELGYIFSQNSFGNFCFPANENLRHKILVFFFFLFPFFFPPLNAVLPFERIRAPKQKSLSAWLLSHKTYHVAANDTILLSLSLLSQIKLSI